MPWKELCTMGIREEFVLRASAPEANVAALCREFGVSRKTGYKWLARFAEEGVSGLEDMSRRPKESPLAVSGDVVAELVAVRVAHPTWGAKKVLEVARRHIPPDEMPSRSTVERVLKRAGLVQPGRKRAPQSSQEPRRAPRVDVKGPNDLWTVDFKGWWLAMDKTRCEPDSSRCVQPVRHPNLGAGEQQLCAGDAGVPSLRASCRHPDGQRAAVCDEPRRAGSDEAVGVVVEPGHRPHPLAAGDAVGQRGARADAQGYGGGA